MSPRLKRPRKILNPPPVRGFKPYGPDKAKLKEEPVILHYEEYEALRLCDYDMLNHHEASIFMGISRPTFTRIYASLRRKMATAFVEGRPLLLEGGKVYFDSEWFHCISCGSFFNNPDKENKLKKCALCGSEDIDTTENNAEPFKEDKCECIKCNYILQHQIGTPCSEEVCPQCGGSMRRTKRNKCKQ